MGRNYIAALVTSNVRALTNHVEEFYEREKLASLRLDASTMVSSNALALMNLFPSDLLSEC
jgi:hypothetical protein